MKRCKAVRKSSGERCSDDALDGQKTCEAHASAPVASAPVEPEVPAEVAAIDPHVAFLVRKHERRNAAPRAAAEVAREKALAALDVLPNGQRVWPDGQGQKPTDDELDEHGLLGSGLW